MFEALSAVDGSAPLAELGRTLGALDQAVEDDVRVDRIRALEKLRGVLAAAQARETVALADSQRATAQARGVPADRAGRGVAAQVGLARRISPYRAGRYVGWCTVLTTELPETYSQLCAGRVSEWRALLVAKETIWLSRAHRAVVDRELAPRLEGLSDRKVEAEAKAIAYRLDPAGYVERLRRAENERHVSLRPAPDTMTRLTALLPLPQGVAAFAALQQAADSAKAAGDERGRGQVMADTLVERVTGQVRAQDVPVTVNLIMTDEALFDTGRKAGRDTETGRDADAPATVVAPGAPSTAIPAELARRAVADASGETSVLLRRLYTRPDTGHLVAMDSTTRLFTADQRAFLLLRDQMCRTPWCDAPIRHADHVTPFHRGGATSIDNGQGLCQACNHAKQADGWAQWVAGEDIVTRTPTGHVYGSAPPRPPGWRPSASSARKPRAGQLSPVELALSRRPFGAA